MTLTEVTKAILKCRPEWTIDAIYHLGEGDECSAYVVNDDWVFRFAKHDRARASLKREYCLLPRLADRITLSIPSPRIALLEECEELQFIAYPLLPGPSLSRETYLGLDLAERTRCAEQVALFLTQMHSTEIGLALGCGVRFADYHEQYAALLSSAQEQLFALLDEPERRFIERVIVSHLESGDATSFRPTLLHGDLSPDHVLFNEKAERVSAIIDFGDMTVGDVAWDFVHLYEDYGLDFMSRVVTAYGEPDQTSLLRRVYQFWLLNSIEWAVDCPINGDDFLEAVAQLRIMRIQEKPAFEELLSTCRPMS